MKLSRTFSCAWLLWSLALVAWADAASEARAAYLAVIDRPRVAPKPELAEPGIDGRFDGPAMLALIAPRPLLVVNGDSDANTPHRVNPESIEAGIAWFTRWLRP